MSINDKSHDLTGGLEHPVDILKDLMKSCDVEMTAEYEKEMRAWCDKEEGEGK